jgi:N-methylhydantoinase B
MPAPASGASGGLTGSGLNPRSGRWSSFHEIYNGGGGGRPHEDGVSAQDDLAINVLNTPVESMETEFPIRIDRYALLPDSAGAGKFRGGLGAVRDWRVIADEMVFNLRTDRFKYSQLGVMSAKPAKPSTAVLNPGTVDEKPMFSKVAGLRLKKNEVVSWRLAGGGGWGDPFERDIARVREDVAQGYITAAAAESEYGVVIDAETLAVDEARTAARRAAKQPKTEVKA